MYHIVYLLLPFQILFSNVAVTLSEHNLDKILRKQETFFSNSKPDVKLNEKEMTRRAKDIIGAYEDYLSSNPDDINALILYGKFLRKVGQGDYAIEFFIRADDLNPRIAVVKQQIANYLIENSQPVEAFPYIILTVELEPQRSVYHYDLGNFLYLFSDELIDSNILSEKSVMSLMHKSFKQASLLEPENIDIQLRYAQSFFDFTDSNKTEALGVWSSLEKKFDKRSKFEQDYIKLCQAKTLIKLERPNEAINIIKTITSEKLGKTKNVILQECMNSRNKNDLKKPSKIIQNKQSYIEPNYKNYLPDDPQLERLRILTNKLIEKKMLENLRIDAIKAVYNQSGEIQIQITKSP